jgi:hypothetical protein
VEHQNLDRKLKAEWNMEGSVGIVGTAWEKAAVGPKMEMEMEKKTMWKRTAVTENEKTEWESLYQNRCNTRQMDGRTILYNLKKRKTNQE